MIEGQEGVTWPQWVALARAAEEAQLDALFRSDHYRSIGRGDPNGALDASLLGEPYAIQFEQSGAIVRLAQDFVNDFQVTAVYFDAKFAKENDTTVIKFLTAYLLGAQDLQGEGYRAPENLAILEKIAKVPAATIAASSLPYHDPDGQVHVADFQKLAHKRLLNLVERAGILVLASHDLDLLRLYCNKVMRLEGGVASPVTDIRKLAELMAA